MSATYEDFEEKIGPALTNALERVLFVPSDFPDANITGIYEEMMPIAAVEQDLEMRRIILQRMRVFFEEIAVKAQTLAVTENADLVIDSSFVAKFTEITVRYFDRAISGDLRYLPYMNKEMPEDSIGAHCVMLRFMMAIVRKPHTTEPPKFSWMVTTEHWIASPTDSDVFEQGCTIEATDVD
jgi:hypothetical protein